ncbi:hypothetical protein CFOL_v3_36381, partial [Cephalotus follicularis]
MTGPCSMSVIRKWSDSFAYGLKWKATSSNFVLLGANVEPFVHLCHKCCSLNVNIAIYEELDVILVHKQILTAGISFIVQLRKFAVGNFEWVYSCKCHYFSLTKLLELRPYKFST